MTDDQLTGIAERLAQATRGPWAVAPRGNGLAIIGGRGDRPAGPSILTVEAAGFHEHRQANADLIAHAPEDIAALLREVRMLRGRP